MNPCPPRPTSRHKSRNEASQLDACRRSPHRARPELAVEDDGAAATRDRREVARISRERGSVLACQNRRRRVRPRVVVSSSLLLVVDPNSGAEPRAIVYEGRGVSRYRLCRSCRGDSAASCPVSQARHQVIWPNLPTKRHLDAGHTARMDAIRIRPLQAAFVRHQILEAEW